MSPGIATHVGVTQPVLPCAVGVAIPCAKRGLDLIIGVPLVEKLFRNYLDSSFDVFFAYPPYPYGVRRGVKTAQIYPANTWPIATRPIQCGRLHVRVLVSEVI